MTKNQVRVQEGTTTAGQTIERTGVVYQSKKICIWKTNALHFVHSSEPQNIETALHDLGSGIAQHQSTSINTDNVT